VNTWSAFAWGACGGLIVEALELYRAVRRAKGLPWKKDPEHEPGPSAVILMGLLRTLIGAVVALAMARANQISGALGGLGAGAAAPLIIDQLGQSGRTSNQLGPPAGQSEPALPAAQGSSDG
jgi:hypothetical protein